MFITTLTAFPKSTHDIRNRVDIQGVIVGLEYEQLAGGEVRCQWVQSNRENMLKRRVMLRNLVR